MLETEPGLQAGSLRLTVRRNFERQSVELIAFAANHSCCNLHCALDRKILQQLDEQHAGVVGKRGLIFLARPRDENDELPPCVLVPSAQPHAQIIQRAAADLLVPLGELLGEDRIALASE